MSILKAYRADFTTRDLDDILHSFQAALENKLEVGKLDKDAVVALVGFYAEYGVSYLRQVAFTFRDPSGAQESMKFMNSVIAEAVNEAGLHYYNKEHGYSIVDKAVQLALDCGGKAVVNDILDVISEIEESYVEEELEELEEE